MTLAIVPLAVLVACLLGVLVVVGMNFVLWLRVKAASAPVAFTDLILMRLRRLNPDVMVDCLIALDKAGIRTELNDLEAHVLAGGDVLAVTDALISAEKAELGVGYHTMAAIDLAGRDVVDAVNSRVRPKVLLCPPEHLGLRGITGVARDGIRLSAKARVTVRTDLSRLVGGAGAETVVARVGEGIVAAIGQAASHKDILEKPEVVARYLLAKGLDSGTCFEILSVDVADVDVLDNVAAKLMSIRADADKRIAQAKAEVRRAAAQAERQEMEARTTEMQSRVVSAKANVPKGLSAAFRGGRMGVPRPLTPMLARTRWKARRPG